jgi:uncharacterized GH25 family protein
VKVHGIDPLDRPDANGLGTDNRLNLIWSAFPLGATTDADGRFTIPGLPRDRVVTLIVTHAEHERLAVYAATTDQPQPDAVSRTFRSGQAIEHRQPVFSATFTLTAKPTNHVLTGRVVYEADGKPADGATVLHHSRPVKADPDGRYRIEGLAAGPLELHAISGGSDAAPLDLTVEIPDEPREETRDLTLPRGLVVTGRVFDGATGQGVAKAGVAFTPDPVAGRKPTVFGFSKETDAEGRFRLVVPPGRGTLQLRSTPPGFPPLPRLTIGTPPDPQLARDVEGQGGQTVEAAEFRLTRAAGLVLRVLDPAGRPVANARVDVRDINRWPRNEPGRTDAQGRFEAVGLAPGQTTVFDVIADDAPLGATIEIDAEPAPAGAGGIGKTVDVTLQALGSLSGRVLDDEGRPLAAPVLHLYRDVTYRDASGRSFGLPVETRNEVNADGSYTFDRLVPGATYHSQAEAGGHATASGKHVKIAPGLAARVDEFRLPAVDGEVRGVVVDPQGKPVSGVTVGYERTDRTRSLYAPTGAVWFQTTDATGRFHLTGLPRGPIRLMAFRRPEGASRAIRNIKYVDVPPGAAEVRIELTDANDRLRGID